MKDEENWLEPAYVRAWPHTGRFLGIGRSKTFELISAGVIPSVRFGRAVRVPVAGLREFAARLAAGEASATGQAGQQAAAPPTKPAPPAA